MAAGIGFRERQLGWAGNIPNFKNEFYAAAFAERERPFEAALGFLDEGYGQRYGQRAYEAAVRCRAAALRGDLAALQIQQQLLSRALAKDRPDLFQATRPRPRIAA